ncbi:hypothetical protein JD844_007428 [Phrynosoma platyrhinos]|uniref:Uncharacterized protein n=1 Tax=Phrynosoma platyrhinos TaxID=52577 RepID=A0ABQ7T462_PHRPL|nr:hypothetical protein JD844_007428 [Phrynosoma platyrhinos]
MDCNKMHIAGNGREEDFERGMVTPAGEVQLLPPPSSNDHYIEIAPQKTWSNVLREHSLKSGRKSEVFGRRKKMIIIIRGAEQKQNGGLLEGQQFIQAV